MPRGFVISAYAASGLRPNKMGQNAANHDENETY
jgi:hypothetical protein